MREQGLIAIMLAVLGGSLLVTTALLADPPVPNAQATDVIRTFGAAGLVTLMLVVTAGMVCGGALFAAEKEAGTMAFLEALPTGRWQLWRAKLVAGLVLAVVQVGLLLVVAAVMGVADGARVRGLVLYALLAYAWGTLGSTLSRTTLGSVGIAIPAATLATFVFLLPVYLFFSQSGSGLPRTSGLVFFFVMMLVTPLVLSGACSSQPLTTRGPRTHPPRPSVRAARRSPRFRWAAPGRGFAPLVWLTARQLWVPGAILSAFAFAFGVSLLLSNLPTAPDQLRPVFLWPVLALERGRADGGTRVRGRTSAPIRSVLVRTPVAARPRVVGEDRPEREFAGLAAGAARACRVSSVRSSGRETGSAPIAPRSPRCFGATCSTNWARKPGSTSSCPPCTGSPWGTCAASCSASSWWRAGWR